MKKVIFQLVEEKMVYLINDIDTKTISLEENGFKSLPQTRHKNKIQMDLRLESFFKSHIDEEI